MPYLAAVGPQGRYLRRSGEPGDDRLQGAMVPDPLVQALVAGGGRRLADDVMAVARARGRPVRTPSPLRMPVQEARLLSSRRHRTGGRRVESEGARVLLVEDDSAVRDAVEIAFRGEGFDVRAEADGSAIQEIVRTFHPDVAILDVRLPTGPDGYTMVKQLRAIDDLPLVLLTSADSLDDRLTGFRAGADDYVSKPFSMAELLARVEALLRRSGRSSDATFRVGDLVVADATRTVTRAGVEIELTRTEYDLLSVLCRSAGEVLSRKQLLQEVWGGYDYYADNVVEVHLSALRRKLEARGPRIIHTVRSVGYVLRA